MIWAKMIAIVGLISALALWYESKTDEAYDNGYDKATLKYEKKFIAQTEKSEKEAQAKLFALQEVSDKWKSRAEAKQKPSRVIEYVYKNIEKEVYVCDDLGANFLRVFNENRREIFKDDG